MSASCVDELTMLMWNRLVVVKCEKRCSQPGLVSVEAVALLCLAEAVAAGVSLVAATFVSTKTAVFETLCSSALSVPT